MNQFLADLVEVLRRGFSVSVLFNSRFAFAFPPSQSQTVIGINFVHEKGSNIMTGNPVLNPANPADNITSRPVSVVVGGLPAVQLDMMNPATTFSCNPGDTGTVTPLGDINANGQGPAGPPFSFTATVTGGKPAIQNVTGVNFAP